MGDKTDCSNYMDIILLPTT